MGTRLGPIVAAALLLTGGCGDHSSPTDQPLSGIQGKGGVLSGEVLGLQFSAADSTLVPVPSRVLAFNVGLIPPDSLATPLALRMPLSDPGDTIITPPPPPPPPGDTVVTPPPGDTIVTPPPPPPSCAQGTEPTAVVETDADGRFEFVGLDAARYDLRVEPLSTAFGTSTFCGVHLLPDRDSEVTIYVPPAEPLD